MSDSQSCKNARNRNSYSNLFLIETNSGYSFSDEPKAEKVAPCKKSLEISKNVIEFDIIDLIVREPK